MLQILRLAIVATSVVAGLGVTATADAAPGKPKLSDINGFQDIGPVGGNAIQGDVESPKGIAEAGAATGGLNIIYPAPPPPPPAATGPQAHSAPELDPAGAAAVGMILVGACIILLERRRARA